MGSFADPNHSTRWDAASKRAVDIVLACLGLVISAPLMAVAALAIALEDGEPVFFSQTRLGKGGAPFRIYKLRSMTVSSDGPAITGSNDPRVSRTGRILRLSKIDELPQFWNVLRGDMSVVGPRPEVPRFVNLKELRWKNVLAVRPGITDLSTLVYRNEESLLAAAADREEYYRNTILPAKLDLSARYLKKRSFWSDIKLLAWTAGSTVFPALQSPEQLKRTFLDGTSKRHGTT